MQHMYLLLTIVNRRDEDDFLQLFERHGVPRTYSTPCRGTTLRRTLDLLGLEDTEKVAHLSPVTHNLASEVLEALTREMQIDLPQRGIALTVPMASISGATALSVFAGGHEHDEMKGEHDRMETQKELIVVICEKGHTDEVMHAARGAGAGGGTILHAKGTGTELAQKFYGVTLAEEKELVLIVARTEQKKPIMRAITEEAGLNTPARAVSFSLPVTETAGLRFFED